MNNPTQKQPKSRIVFSVEEFAKMSSDVIAKYIRTHPNARIVGDNPGIDRHIIESLD